MFNQNTQLFLNDSQWRMMLFACKMVYEQQGLTGHVNQSNLDRMVKTPI